MAALARVERTDFLSPVCIGEVANVSAEITYTSRHSVEVQVNVMSENILTGGWPQVTLSQNSSNNRDPMLCSLDRAASGKEEIFPFIGSAGRGGAGGCREGKPNRLPGDYRLVDCF